MAKQRLVDFRGGINKKISPHMIGDSQGQDAQDLEMSSVRLQGRYEIDTNADGANGSFWYDSGVSTGRWVSKYTEDDTGVANEPYIAGATDFAIWNRDLYVARTSSPGTLIVFRDGASTPAVLQFDPPVSVEASVSIPQNTLTNSVEDALIAAIPAQNATTQTVNVDVAGSNSNAAEFNYSLSGSAIRQPWETATYETWTKTGDSTTYYRYSGDYLYTRSTGSSGNVAVTVSIANRFSPAYTIDSGNYQENGYTRWYQGSTVYWSNGTYLYSRTTSTSSATNVTTSNYNSYTWSNGDTYTRDGGTETVSNNTYTRYYRNIAGSTSNRQELWALNDSGNLLVKSSGSTSTTTTSLPSISNSQSSLHWWYYIFTSPSNTFDVSARYRVYRNDTSSYSTYTVIQTYSSSSTAANVTTMTTAAHPDGSYAVFNRGGRDASSDTSNARHYYISGTLYIPTTTYTYSNHTNTYISYSYSLRYDSYSLYNYSGPKTEVRQVPYVPETPAYYYDDARSVLYIVRATDADVGDSSPSFSNQWLVGGRDFSLSDDGYYVRSVREAYSNNVSTYLPLLSQDYTKVTLATNNSWIFGTTKENTPQRLDFNLSPPTDTSNDPLVCYRLERRDSFNSVAADLCYFKPDSTTAFFAYSTSTKKVTFVTSTLDTNKRYKVSWVAYQDSTVRAINGSTIGSASISGEYEFDGSDEANLSFEIVDGTDTRYRAADFRLSERVIDPNPSVSGSTGTFALIRCFDIFDKNNGSTIQGECDFLEGYANGLGCGGLDSDSTNAGVPDYLKFLEESNNFFFGVGTSQTNDTRYGGANNVNKAGSFLFVSDYNNPRNWELDSYVQFDEEITGIHSYPGELIVWTKNATYRVFGSRPNEMRKIKLATTEGLLANEERSIALVGNYLVWVSQSGICFYDGARVTNLTRGRFNPDDLTTNLLNKGSSIHASQVNDRYYVINATTEQGFMVDFSLEGFPVVSVDLKEGATAGVINSSHPTLTNPVRPPVLVYKANENKLYSRRGVVEGNTGNRIAFTYKTRAFDGGAFGSLKLVKSITINGTGSGSVRLYLDGRLVEQPLTDWTLIGAPIYDADNNLWIYSANGLTHGLEITQIGTNLRWDSQLLVSDTNPPAFLVPGTTYYFPGGTYNTFPAGQITIDPDYFEIASTPSVTDDNGTEYYQVRKLTYDYPVTITSGLESEPKRVFLPASRSNSYGLPVADTWWAEIRNWNGRIDWIDTDYEVIAG